MQSRLGYLLSRIILPALLITSTSLAAVVTFDARRPQVDVVGVYGGKCRDISNDKKDFLRQASIVFKDISPVLRLYTKEVLILAGEKGLWVPIQDQVWTHFRQEVKTGDELYIFARLLGALPDRTP